LARPLGRVGTDVTEDHGYEAARLTGLAILASLRQALGDLDRIETWLRVFGLVNIGSGFNRFPMIINGFSDLILEVAPRRVHIRVPPLGWRAVSFDIPVEIEAKVAIRGT
jgi:hypothetical protein